MHLKNKHFLLLALISLIISLSLFLTDKLELTGPFIIGFFVFLAIGIRSIGAIKGISFGLWILASVTTAMYYPSSLQTWGDFNLKVLIIPLLQIIMFGMG